MVEGKETTEVRGDGGDLGSVGGVEAGVGVEAEERYKKKGSSSCLGRYS